MRLWRLSGRFSYLLWRLSKALNLDSWTTFGKSSVLLFDMEEGVEEGVLPWTVGGPRTWCIPRSAQPIGPRRARLAGTSFLTFHSLPAIRRNELLHTLTLGRALMPAGLPVEGRIMCHACGPRRAWLNIRSTYGGLQSSSLVVPLRCAYRK